MLLHFPVWAVWNHCRIEYPLHLFYIREITMPCSCDYSRGSMLQRKWMWQKKITCIGVFRRILSNQPSCILVDDSGYATMLLIISKAVSEKKMTHLPHGAVSLSLTNLTWQFPFLSKEICPLCTDCLYLICWCIKPFADWEEESKVVCVPYPLSPPSELIRSALFGMFLILLCYNTTNSVNVRKRCNYKQKYGGVSARGPVRIQNGGVRCEAAGSFWSDGDDPWPRFPGCHGRWQPLRNSFVIEMLTIKPLNVTPSRPELSTHLNLDTHQECIRCLKDGTFESMWPEQRSQISFPYSKGSVMNKGSHMLV